MRTKGTALAILLAFHAALLACGGDDGQGSGDGDSSTDAPPVDASADTHVDARADAGGDASADAGADASTDAGVDASTDAQDDSVTGPDSQTDARLDGGYDATPDAPTDGSNDGGTQEGGPADASSDYGIIITVDSGPTCPASVSGFTPPAYVPAVGHQGACTASDISSFVSACIAPTGNTTTCGMWEQTYGVDAGHGATTSCGNCIFAAANNGGIWLDPGGEWWVNTAGCVQLLDPVNGMACAQDYHAYASCFGAACDPCGVPSSAFDICYTTETECSSYSAAYQSTCASELTDGGVFDSCIGSSALNISYVLGVICGSADGG